MSTLVERLQTEAALCRNEGADDIANLLDEAVKELAHLRHGFKYPLGMLLILKRMGKNMGHDLVDIDRWIAVYGDVK